MEPKEKARDLINDLISRYGVDKKQAVELAMFTVDQVISYREIHDQNFWMQTMEELDNLTFQARWHKKNSIGQLIF